MTLDEHHMTPDEVVATEINIMGKNRGPRAQLVIFTIVLKAFPNPLVAKFPTYA